MILVSACLLGCQCRHDGKNNHDPLLLNRLRGHCLLPICPEQLGGLSTPRSACEIRGGDGRKVLAGRARVITHDDQDCTEAFIKGARETLHLAQQQNITQAILKSRSPSCSPSSIYSGSFTRCLKSGVGVTAALLMERGISVRSETDLRVEKTHTP